MAGTVTKAGRYQIVAELGRGSMGVVYQGFDPVIGRTVAIKTMLTEGLTPAEFEEYKARFQREAQAAGMLAHPNIVTVYDFGEDQDFLYLAMEFLEGKSLQKLIEEQNILPIETIVPMYEQVCNALDHAHKHNIVHRDIKPANIMILESGLVKVTDFGIAKIMSTGMTQAGQILGTPNYMSPEQVKGRPVDGRADAFSLGVILYELVTGEKPFSGQNITTVIYKIVNENPIPPRELDATIHPGLSYVISKALAKSPDERYQTCRDLAADLRNYKNLAGATAPSATVIMRVPPIQNLAVDSGVPPAATQAGHAQQLPQAPGPAAPSGAPEAAYPPRPLSVQVIPPVKPQPQRSSAAVWLFLILLLAGGLGSSYYFLLYQPRHRVAREKLPVISSGGLTVTADIEGAKIALDGRSDPGWATPHTFPDLPPGLHDVVISKEGYPDVRQNVSVEAGQNQVLNLKFIAPVANAGQLEVKANVPGAKISIDGRTDPGWVTPHTFSNLPAGAHLVAISKDGYEAWEKSVNMEAGQPNSISGELSTLARPKPPLTNPRAAPKLGQLQVAANVEGAKISIDGRSDPDWVTPHTFKDLAAGTHAVVISKDGYDDAQRSVTIEGGRTASITAELTMPTGELEIVTIPSGVEVYIDGRSYGPSPVQATLGVGRHSYVIKQGGAEVYSNFAELKSGQILRRRINLGETPTGIVVVRTIPPGATVYADGTSEGRTPTSFQLTAGRHTLTISLSGFRPLQKEIDVLSGGSIPVNETLSPR